MLLEAPPAPVRNTKWLDVVVTAAPEISKVLAEVLTELTVRAEATVVGFAGYYKNVLPESQANSIIIDNYLNDNE